MNTKKAEVLYILKQTYKIITVELRTKVLKITKLKIAVRFDSNRKTTTKH